MASNGRRQTEEMSRVELEVMILWSSGPCFLSFSASVAQYYLTALILAWKCSCVLTFRVDNLPLLCLPLREVSLTVFLKLKVVLLFFAPAVHSLKLSRTHVDWHSVDEVYLYSDATTSKIARTVTQKLGFSKGKPVWVVFICFLDSWPFSQGLKADST